MRLYRRLLPIAALLALAVVGLGAWVRLSDAGLGCPDWPGCYGQWLVPEHAADASRAWKEMIHRYLAGSLGLCIFALGFLAWRHRTRVSPVLPSLLCAIVVCQALLGMWTVTLLLKPLVVTAHLLGGMTTLALLVWLHLRQSAVTPGESVGPGLKAGGLLALVLLVLQIGLGGWVSSNYAALACPDFPTCHGNWLPATDFARAFALHRGFDVVADGGLLPDAALVTIHWSHRLGALLVAVTLGGLGIALLRRPGWAGAGSVLLALLVAQAGLGIANVLFARPLIPAVAHNLGAALLLVVVLWINHRFWQHSPGTLPEPASFSPKTAPKAGKLSLQRPRPGRA